MEESFFETLTFEPDHSSELPISIKSDLLSEIARNFQANIISADELLNLPLVLMLVGSMETTKLVLTTQVMVEKRAYHDWETSVAARRSVEEEVKRRLDEQHPDIRRATEKKLRSLFREGTLGRSMRALTLATLSSLWASFESLAKDSWIALINVHARELGQQAIQGLTEASPIEGLTNKSISVGILAKYNFDLHTCLGDILAPKFDFTGVSGIRQAYTAVLGKAADLQTIFDNTDLTELEATRHMIVHRSGIVDEDFKKRTNSPLPIGTKYEPDSATFSKLANAAFSAGCSLLHCVDIWLQTNPS